MNNEWLVLQNNEDVLYTLKPKISAWYVIAFVSKLFIFFMIGIVIFIDMQDVFLLYTILFSLGLSIISVLYDYLKYRQEVYVVTSKRIIRKQGLIGYSVTSVPYNRLSDVITTRYFYEMIFGVSSLNFQTLSGQSYSSNLGSEISFNYIENAQELQKRIYSLINTRTQNDDVIDMIKDKAKKRDI